MEWLQIIRNRIKYVHFTDIDVNLLNQNNLHIINHTYTDCLLCDTTDYDETFLYVRLNYFYIIASKIYKTRS